MPPISIAAPAILRPRLVRFQHDIGPEPLHADGVLAICTHIVVKGCK